jgi:hypothetical protein
MKLRKIALHIIIFIAILVVISAVAIWFGLGPVVHSADQADGRLLQAPASDRAAGRGSDVDALAGPRPPELLVDDSRWREQEQARASRAAQSDRRDVNR